MNLQTSSAQEVFDFAVRHLLAQNRESVSTEGGCAYRGVDGLKCAAGAFLSDNEYCSWMEGKSWTQLVEQGCVPNNHADLIQDLQYIHDRGYPNEWRDCLLRLARRRGLEFRA